MGMGRPVELKQPVLPMAALEAAVAAAGQLRQPVLLTMVTQVGTIQRERAAERAAYLQHPMVAVVQAVVVAVADMGMVQTQAEQGAPAAQEQSGNLILVQAVAAAVPAITAQD
jgi:hypothetical protein